MKINFKCPWCNGDTLRQTRRFVTVSQKIEDITINTMTLSSDYDIHGGNEPNFECAKCGTALHLGGSPITEIKDLFEALQNSNMLETNQEE